MDAINKIKDWLQLQSQSVSSTKPAPAKNQLSLFTGDETKSLFIAAERLAKETGKELYRVDLSKLGSQYIGQTEKNLAAVFHRAQATNSILFFDEADALFGKRSGVQDSHDRYANIEVAKFLQLAEAYSGLVILAVKKAAIDQAFLRRFHTVVSFPLSTGNRV